MCILVVYCDLQCTPTPRFQPSQGPLQHHFIPGHFLTSSLSPRVHEPRLPYALKTRVERGNPGTESRVSRLHSRPGLNAATRAEKAYPVEGAHNSPPGSETIVTLVHWKRPNPVSLASPGGSPPWRFA